MNPNKAWLRPSVENSRDRMLIEPDGTVRHDVEVYVTEEEFRRQWAGYECPWCYQILEHAFERTCKDWCFGGREVTKAQWHRYMEESFGGVEWFGPTPGDKLEEENRLDRQIWTPTGRR